MESVLDKYRPTSLRPTEFVGNRRAVGLMRKWFQEMQAQKPPHPLPKNKLLVLSGPTGVGKTIAAHILCQEYAFSPTEISAGDERGERVFAEYCASFCAHPCDFSGARRIALIEDVDQLSKADVALLAKNLEHLRAPVICIGNAPYKNGVLRLAGVEHIRFYALVDTEVNQYILDMMLKMCGRTPTSIEFKNIAVTAAGDMRRLLYTIYTLSLDPRRLASKAVPRAPQPSLDQLSHPKLSPAFISDVLLLDGNSAPAPARAPEALPKPVAARLATDLRLVYGSDRTYNIFTAGTALMSQSTGFDRRMAAAAGEPMVFELIHHNYMDAPGASLDDICAAADALSEASLLKDAFISTEMVDAHVVRAGRLACESSTRPFLRIQYPDMRVREAKANEARAKLLNFGEAPLQRSSMTPQTITTELLPLLMSGEMKAALVRNPMVGRNKDVPLTRWYAGLVEAYGLGVLAEKNKTTDESVQARRKVRGAAIEGYVRPQEAVAEHERIVAAFADVALAMHEPDKPKKAGPQETVAEDDLLPKYVPNSQKKQVGSGEYYIDLKGERQPVVATKKRKATTRPIDPRYAKKAKPIASFFGPPVPKK